ncbi:MAG: PDZ domain-containing protein [Myxococcales bacterium]|nr:PDZ domain-containing protein [Myxococcales bacterium]
MVSTLGHALHTLASGLLRRTWLVALVAVIVCSAFAARAVAALVEADYLAAPTHGSTPPPAAAREPAPTRTKPDASGLVARNMFCSTCDPAPVPGPGPTKTSYSGRPAVLIATGVGADPWATVRVVETEVQGSFGLGDTIPGVGRIDRIGGVSIDVIDASGHRGTLSLRETAAATAVSQAPAAPAPPAADDPFASRVRQLDDHTYEVDKNLVRELVTGAAKPGAMRMTPIVKAGEVQGVRVFGVKPGSAAHAIGMKNGDQITAIDGDPIKNAQQLLDLYAKLDNLTGVELQGTRAGKPLAIALRLR